MALIDVDLSTAADTLPVIIMLAAHIVAITEPARPALA